MVRSKFRDEDDDPDSNLDGYYHVVAHQKARDRRQRLRKLYRYEHLKQQVVTMLKELWSPEQISGRIKHESSEASVCPETIYQYIYSPQGRESELYQYLEKARKKRRRHYSRKHRGFVVPVQKLGQVNRVCLLPHTQRRAWYRQLFL